MLIKRGNVWHVSIPRGGQKPIRCSARTSDKGKAQEFHDKLANDSWRTRQLGEKPKKRWEEAVVSYLEHVRKRSLEDDKEKLRWLDSRLSGCTLEEIAGVGDNGFSKKWDAVLSEKKAEVVSDATLNRYTALVRKILRDHGILPKLRTYQEPKPRRDFLTKEVAFETLQKAPDWARDPMLFDWAEGPRKENLLGLEWSWIDLQRRIWRPNPELFKNGECPELPLSDFAIGIIRRQLGKHQRYVFVRDGERITEDAWRWMWDKIRPVVNGKPITFHSAGRKTWASWLRQHGVSCEDIQDAGGWKTLSVVKDTYAHIQPEHLQKHLEKLSGTLHELDTHQRIDVLQVSAGKGI